MNRLKYYNTRFDIPLNRKYITNVEPPKRIDVKDKNKQLLDFIFGQDPITGHPSGDLSMYMSDNVNPEVRLFIERNLMNDVSSSSPISMSDDEVNAMNQKLTDDDIAKYSRNHGESREDYAKRLNGYFAEERYKRQRDLELKRLKKIVDASN